MVVVRMEQHQQGVLDMLAVLKKSPLESRVKGMNVMRLEELTVLRLTMAVVLMATQSLPTLR